MTILVNREVDFKRKYQFLEQDSESYFEGSHNIYTPRNIVEEILGHIDLKDKDILVLFNLEFVLSLVYTSKIAPERITFYGDHPRKLELARKLGVHCTDNMAQLKTTDVIVGNPPFQDTTARREKFNQLGNKKLYKSFMALASRLITEGGTVALVVPAAVLKTTNYGQPGKAFEAMDSTKISVINTDVNKHFPTVGIDICYFVAKKTENDVMATVNGMPYDFNRIGFVTKEYELQSIAQKILRTDGNVTVERTNSPKATTGLWTTRFAYLRPSVNPAPGQSELFWGYKEPAKLLRLMQSNLFARVAWDGFVVTDKRWYHNFWSALYVHPGLRVEMTDDEIMDLYGLTAAEKATVNRVDRLRITKEPS